MPVGVYTTNNAEACQYIAENSDCEVAVVENNLQLKKYLISWEKLPKLKCVVLYNDKIPADIPI